MVVPIVKKGERRKVEEYRGVTLLSTVYKMYASVLAERIREETERKGIIPQNQMGFRKGIGTIWFWNYWNYIGQYICLELFDK